MKRAVRTVIRWDFQDGYPCSIVEDSPKLNWVMMTLLQGEAKMEVEFVDPPKDRDPLGSHIAGLLLSDAGESVRQAIGVIRDYRDDCEKSEGFASSYTRSFRGNVTWLRFKVPLQNGEAFLHTAVKAFLRLYTVLVDLEYRRRRILPTPQVFQETMVKEHIGWTPYGEYIWNQYYTYDANHAVRESCGE